MRDLLSPKQVARALDVSESSVKRWCDRGVIATQYTAGGHRRIPLAAMMEFVRVGKHVLVHPEALGLPATSGQSERVVERAREKMTAALLAGDESGCRQLAIDLYLAEHSLSVICDDVFAAAFRDIGNRWSCGEAEVYQERRGCEITMRILRELRALLPSTLQQAPLAIGCAPAGDPYSLGTTMAELVLRDAKWNAVSLGNNLPFATIVAAIREHRPKLVWLSCSFLTDAEAFLSGYVELYEECATEVALVVGGYALIDGIRKRMKYSAYCDNMRHLEGFAQTLLAAIDRKTNH